MAKKKAPRAPSKAEAGASPAKAGTRYVLCPGNGFTHQTPMAIPVEAKAWWHARCSICGIKVFLGRLPKGGAKPKRRRWRKAYGYTRAEVDELGAVVDDDDES